MINGKQILPECYGDTTLIEVLEYKNPSHTPSVTRVLATLADVKRATQTLVGIIDDDKKKPASFQEYLTIDETPNLIKKNIQPENITSS